MRNAGLSFKKLKEFATSEFSRLENDPFGKTSIDPHVSEDFTRSRRAVNHLSAAIQAVIRYPVAIKSSIRGREAEQDLIEQYLFMRELQFAAEERFTQSQKEILECLPVYAAVKIGTREFLIMKRILDAHEIEDQLVPYLSLGWPGGDDPIHEEAFSASYHKDFLKALGLKSTSGYVKWRLIERELGQILGVQLYDILGRNVLYYQNGGRKKYFIIDQFRVKKYVVDRDTGEIRRVE